MTEAMNEESFQNSFRVMKCMAQHSDIYDLIVLFGTIKHNLTLD